MRISVLGFSCSGKTTFSNRLGEILHEPVYHLDSYYWKTAWTANENFEIESLINLDSWIMDGTYSECRLQDRMERSEYIFYLDCNLIVRLSRMIIRHLSYEFFPKGKNPISQKISFKFVLSTIKKVLYQQPRLICHLKQYYGNKFLRIRGRKQADHVLEEVRNGHISKLFRPD